jgi:hypothetical protein
MVLTLEILPHPDKSGFVRLTYKSFADFAKHVRVPNPVRVKQTKLN